MKKAIFIIGILLLSACSGVSVEDYKSDVPERPAFEDRVVARGDLLPNQYNNPMPFYSQAPDGDWSLPWEEACEEASLALAYHALRGNRLSLETFKREVLEMVTWQERNFGYYESTTVDETVRMLEEYYAFGNYEILESPTVDDLKKALAEGSLIVAPFAGRMLQNPFYSGEGPYYHMLVIRGYDEENFITNDVGTKHGENFIYSYETTMNALHDYSPKNIEEMPKRVIVLK